MIFYKLVKKHIRAITDQSFPYENYWECYKKLASFADCCPCYLHLPIFSHTFTPLFCWKIRNCDHCFPQQIRPQTLFSDIYYRIILVRIGFNMINKHHRLPILYTSLVKLCFNHYCFTKS